MSGVFFWQDVKDGEGGSPFLEPEQQARVRGEGRGDGTRNSRDNKERANGKGERGDRGGQRVPQSEPTVKFKVQVAIPSRSSSCMCLICFC
jgi:hypothetical protein